MPQRLVQTQSEQLAQQQRLSQQQILEVKLLEMPLAELEQNVAAELDDNPALEQDRTPGDDADDYADATGEADGDGNDNTEAADADGEQDSRDEIDEALGSLEGDDDVPTADSRLAQPGVDAADQEEMVWGDTTSFYDRLKEQMGETQLTDEEHTIMEYLIGSLDTDGLLRKPLDSICDELAIYHGIDVPEQKIEQVLRQLQTFDPAGVGARSLQECLLLQIDRRPKSEVRTLMRTVIASHFDSFTHLHWDKIAAAMHLTPSQTADVKAEIRRLNPKPGAALGETEGKSQQQVTPDFIIDTDEEGHVSFTLNRGRVPELRVAPDFASMVAQWRNNRRAMNRRDKEALLYAKQKVDRAQGFIEAVKQRRHTLAVTMQAIIDWQSKFFTDGDEADLRPMILKDIAERTGLDISTVSRVSNVKYAQTPWGTFPLRYFFSDGYQTADGEETSTRKIKLVLRQLVEGEDHSQPLSDEALAAEMARQGYPIARRTVAKYREQMGLPSARLRRER